MEWLFALLFGAQPVPVKDYTGYVAAEAAYSAAMLTAEPEMPDDRKVNPDCKTCNGTGRVRSGDGQGWSKCPACFPMAAMTAPPAPFQTPAPIKSAYRDGQK
jgi:hypothetical protein